MRTANALDVWRGALKNKNAAFILNKLTTINVKGIGDKEINFPNKITALCGENGVGKTTVLKTIFATLVPKKAALAGIFLRPQDKDLPVTTQCTVTRINRHLGNADPLKTVKMEAPHEIAAFFGDDKDEDLVNYVDAAATAQRLLHLINRDSDFSTALEGMPQIEDSPEVLRLRQEITGRAYASVTSFELDDYDGLPVFPYFRVVVGSTTYCSEDMGLGELCANYLVWALARMKDDCLLLLEEPESHLPPRAQERLMAYIAQLSIDRNVCVVVSTHSQHTLSNIPSTHITFLARLLDRCIVQPNPTMNILYESLRIARIGLCVIVVEDHSAFAFIETIIAKLDSALLNRFDFTWKSGWSDIDEILSKVPRHGPGRVSLLGIYDGDQRESKRPAVHWPYTYLPGTGDPAEYMVRLVREQSEKFAISVNCEVGTVEVAVANLSGVDVKDFFPILKDVLGKNIQHLYQCATELWLLDAENLKLAAELMTTVRANAFR
jgi:energy-coupling factor transporter ATP-binding protein EcfA2